MQSLSSTTISSRGAGAGESAKGRLGSVGGQKSGGNVSRYGKCPSRQLEDMCLFELSLNSRTLFTSTSSLNSKLICCLHYRIMFSYGLNAP